MQQSEIDYYFTWFTTSKFDILQRDYGLIEDTPIARHIAFLGFIIKLLKESK